MQLNVALYKMTRGQLIFPHNRVFSMMYLTHVLGNTGEEQVSMEKLRAHVNVIVQFICNVHIFMHPLACYIFQQEELLANFCYPSFLRYCT